MNEDTVTITISREDAERAHEQGIEWATVIPFSIWPPALRRLLAFVELELYGQEDR